MTNDTTLSLDIGLSRFCAALIGRNRSGATTQAYATDLNQFFTHLSETDVTVRTITDITRQHITEYLSYLAQERELSGEPCPKARVHS